MHLEGHHIHFVCVGGIGMSALAHMALDRGAEVSGCDLNGGAVTRSLVQRGCTIHCGHDPSHLDGVELVVRSSAIAEDHPEIARAFDRHIPVLSRARFLARFAAERRLVAVAGTHGKTTTTWLVGRMLLTAGLDPSIMVGGIVAELRGNYRLGDGEFFVSEIDESDRSHLEFSPFYSILTNIDHDHVDCYPSLADVQRAFLLYLRRTAPDGAVIACADSAPLRETLAEWGGPALTYGFAADASVRATHVRVEGAQSTFDVAWPGGGLRDLVLALPGRHNVQNALAAVAMAHVLGLDAPAVREALGSIRGVGRRLEHKGTAAGVCVYDDYAHHPTEIRATAAAARPLANGGRLVGVFQPHRYSRTQGLAGDFADCFDQLDHLTVLPIYSAGEKPLDGVSSEAIARGVTDRGQVECVTCDSGAAAREHLLALLRSGDLLLTLGAGDVYQLGEHVLAALRGCPLR